MSEKMWEVTLKHARTCTMGTKLYVSHGPNHTIIMNPICQVIKAVINGQTYTNRDLTTLNRVSILLGSCFFFLVNSFTLVYLINSQCY